jgi:hypothetical protein
VSDYHLEDLLERIEHSLQHLARESHKTREELRSLREILLLLLQLLTAQRSYPKTIAITVNPP